jgi:hypothetical protein
MRARCAVLVDDAFQQQVLNRFAVLRLVRGKEMVEGAVLADEHDDMLDGGAGMFPPFGPQRADCSNSFRPYKKAAIEPMPNAGLYPIYCMRPYGKKLPSPKARRSPMTALPTYDIFKRSDSESLVWIETAADLGTANERIKELQENSGGEYIVFDQRKQQIVTVTLQQ